ncbi:hypothetical protein BV898_04232 [Hypsibius exemplaris]|uniref:Uncharacterized protein n=1 Tax=Hypsibius exemplaris TaxID=2072580 RepID=A0A1W0X403_HYPEX|nr:hypothetical protein BV898_04232 [Hypsibius exemplaris]
MIGQLRPRPVPPTCTAPSTTIMANARNPTRTTPSQLIGQLFSPRLSPKKMTAATGREEARIRFKHPRETGEAHGCLLQPRVLGEGCADD